MTTYREEDYLESILHVVNRKGYAKVTDISKHLGCSAATVTEMFSRLSDKGLVNYEKYGGVTLTEKGRLVGTEIDARHQLIRGFLILIGVPEGIADLDACMIEHRVHQESLARLESFIKSYKDDPAFKKKISVPLPMEEQTND